MKTIYQICKALFFGATWIACECFAPGCQNSQEKNTPISHQKLTVKDKKIENQVTEIRNLGQNIKQESEPVNCNYAEVLTLCLKALPEDKKFRLTEYTIIIEQSRYNDNMIIIDFKKRTGPSIPGDHFGIVYEKKTGEVAYVPGR
jgi:hypothetical protein